MASENGTVIGKSVRIVGHVVGSDDLVIDGELEGTAQVPGARLTIGPSARVRADVVAKDVIVLGRLEGDIRATGRVELRSSAMMQGSVFASTLSIEENAAFRGQVDPTRATEPLPERNASPAEVRFDEPRKSDSSPGRSTAGMPAALAAVAAGRPQSAGSATTEERKYTPLFVDNKS